MCFPVAAGLLGPHFWRAALLQVSQSTSSLRMDMDGSTPPMSELYEVIERMIRERAQIEQLQAARHSPLVGRGSFSSSRVYEADGDALGRLFPLDGAPSSLSINWDSVTGDNAWQRRPQFPMSLLNELSDTRHGLMSVAWSENDVMSRGVLSRYQIRHLDNGLPVVPTTNQHKIWDDVLHVFYRFPHEARECLYDRTRIGNTDGLPLSDAGVAKCWTRSLVLRQRTSLAEVCAEVMAQQGASVSPEPPCYRLTFPVSNISAQTRKPSRASSYTKPGEGTA